MNNPNKKTTKYFILFILIISTLLFSCSKKTEVTRIEETVKNYKWFYFIENNFQEIDYPSNAPLSLKKPWTESIRISSIRQSSTFDQTDKNQIPKIFCLVNRLGLIEIENDKLTLASDKLLFDNVTSQGQILINTTPLFLQYKNSFFNDSYNKMNNTSIVFPSLLQFDSSSKTFFPILDAKTLNLDSEWQITDFLWDGKTWFFCLKKSTERETDFKYIKFKPTSPILSILPNEIKLNKESNFDKNIKIALSNSSEKEFREKNKIQNFSKSPGRLKKLLTSVSSKLNFEIECKTIDGTSAKKYENIIDTNLPRIEAKAQISDSWTGVLFTDGTLYFEGSLFNRHSVNNSKPIAIRLPKIPQGFEYSDFGISGDTLYAAWEETSFYKVGRSGFIKVDLNKLFYE